MARRSADLSRSSWIAAPLSFYLPIFPCMTPSPGPDWVAFIAQTGVAGAVLVWFMFRTEGILKRNIDSIDRLSRSMLLMIIALKQAMQTLANIRKLRSDSHDAVVIVITGTPDLKQEAEAAGADVFLGKDDKGFFTKLTEAIVNPPRRPNVKVPEAVKDVEAAARDLVCESRPCPPQNQP
jgi:hypothetical protein